ncbi:unnamed protein product [Moneuplotes crassus]|uniref:Uncharacterized protein n=1 Tax=Euplotes crassus TaxID=5936 RepID=A0AAD1XXV0_EUPCR|nr:unnamed protein product [Moneuplotes crassus]
MEETLENRSSLSKEFGDIQKEWELESFISEKTVSPSWKIFLTNNGLMTPQLKIIANNSGEVKILPKIISEQDLEEGRISREVVLWNQVPENNFPILYAWSEWDKEILDELLPDKSQPIGSLISQKGFDSFRQIDKIYTLRSQEISDHLEYTKDQEETHLVAREYTIYKEHKTLAVFIEVCRFDGKSPIAASLGEFYI